MKPALLALAALLTIAGCSSAEPVEPPTETVTTTATPEAIEVTPQFCLDALDRADEALTEAANGYDILADALKSAGTFDAAGIEQARADFEAQMPKLSSAVETYRGMRDLCQARS